MRKTGFLDQGNICVYIYCRLCRIQHLYETSYLVPDGMIMSQSYNNGTVPYPRLGNTYSYPHKKNWIQNHADEFLMLLFKENYGTVTDRIFKCATKMVPQHND
jgi:hypothetical protein